MPMISQAHNLDLVPNGQPTVVNVSQYDKGSRTLVFNLYKENVAYSPESSATAYILGTKPDGTGFMLPMAIDGSAVSVVINEQMTAVSGDVVCEVRLFDGSGGRLGSANFTLAVERAALEDDTVISETDIPVFEDLVSQAAALFPSGGTVGQVIKKTATGTEWADETGGGGSADLRVVHSNGNVDHTYAEIKANYDGGGNPYLVDGTQIYTLTTINSTNAQFDCFIPTGRKRFTVSSSGTVTYTFSRLNAYAYALTTLGSATATSDSTVYTNGYKLTFSDTSIEQLSTAIVQFPNGDYSGSVTWVTSAGKLELYFDQNPNSKTIWAAWTTMAYVSPSIS